MSDSETPLPANWARANLSDVVALNPRFEPSKVSDGTLISFVPMAAVEAGTGRLNGTLDRPWAEVRKGYTLFRDDDVLFAKITPCMENGKAALAIGLTNGLGAGSTEFFVLRPLGGIDPKYILYFVIQEDFRKSARSKMRGNAGQLRVPKEFMETASIAIPPLSEQRRIVAEIETQFTRLDAAVAALERARANLKRYRTGVLLQAARGRDRFRSQIGSGESGIGSDQELPADWNWVQVRDAGDVQLGRQRSPAHHTGLNMRPYLRVANVYENRLDLSDVMEMNFTPKEFERYELRPGDILLNEGQSIEWVGRPAMYKGEIEGACYQNTLVRFRSSEIVDPRFALIVFRAYLHDGTFQRIARWTVNIAHLGSERFAGLPFPLPPLERQQQIVVEVERLMSVADAIESSIEANQKRGDRLRQSVLRQAFSGQLVHQDPDDEPASVLLERIQAELAKQTPSRNSTRRRLLPAQPQLF